jgi:hypothetical protein
MGPERGKTVVAEAGIIEPVKRRPHHPQPQVSRHQAGQRHALRLTATERQWAAVGNHAPDTPVATRCDNVAMATTLMNSY